MDMSEPNRRCAAPDPDNAETADSARWQDLLAQIGAEIAVPLTSARQRVETLAGSTRIDHHGLRALGDEIERARRAGMLGQQLARLASRQLRQTHEHVALAQAVQRALTRRAPETRSRGIQLKQVLRAAEVMVDGSLLSTLIDALIDWSLTHSQSNIELRIDMRTWPMHARLGCRFAYRPSDQLRPRASGAAVASELDSLTWRLLEQVASTMDLEMTRKDDGREVRLVIEFPRTVNHELDRDFAPSVDFKALAGSQVLVVASRRAIRSQVREAIRHMGLMVDFVSTIDDAAEFCRDGLPHAIVFEAALRGRCFDALRDEISAQAPDLAFIELAEDGNTFEMSGFSGTDCARVGGEAIGQALPSALMFELSKAL